MNIKSTSFFGSLFVALSLFFACASTKGLPSSSGKNPFIGKAFSSNNNEVLAFSSDGTLSIYAIQEDDISKDSIFEYSYDEKNALLYLKAKTVYLSEDVGVSSPKELLDAMAPAKEEALNAMFSQVAFDEESKNIYSKIITEASERRADAYFNVLRKNRYEFMDNGETLLLADEPNVELEIEDISFGLDSTSRYSVALNNGNLVIADVGSSYGQSVVSYIGVAKFSKNNTVVSADMYRAENTFNQNGDLLSMSLSPAGTIQMSCKVSLSPVTEAFDGSGRKLYTATFELGFPKTPEVLSELKEVYYEQNRLITSSVYSTGIVADFSAK